MRCEILSNLTSFHIVRQGASGRGITSVIDTPTTCLPNCTSFSLLCARLALSILIWLTGCGSPLAQFAQSLRQQSNTYRLRKVLAFGHRLPVLLPLVCSSLSLLQVAGSVAFRPPLRKTLLGVKRVSA